MERTHGVTHFDPDECYGCKILTVGVQPSAMPSRNPDASWRRAAEVDLVKDLDAFKSARQMGYMPKSTRGAATLMDRAESEFEVQSGQLAADKAKGFDARKPLTKRGSEWRRRTNEAFQAAKKGEVLTP